MSQNSGQVQLQTPSAAGMPLSPTACWCLLLFPLAAYPSKKNLLTFAILLVYSPDSNVTFIYSWLLLITCHSLSFSAVMAMFTLHEQHWESTIPPCALTGCHWSPRRGATAEAGEILQHLPTNSGAVLWDQEAGVCTPGDTLLTSPRVGKSSTLPREHWQAPEVENSTYPWSCPILPPAFQDSVYRRHGKHKGCFYLSGSRQWFWPDCFSFHHLFPTQPQHSPICFSGKLI